MMKRNKLFLFLLMAIVALVAGLLVVKGHWSFDDPNIDPTQEIIEDENDWWGAPDYCHRYDEDDFWYDTFTDE